MCICASPPVSTSLFFRSSMAMSFHPTAVLSLLCSLTPRLSSSPLSHLYCPFNAILLLFSLLSCVCIISCKVNPAFSFSLIPSMFLLSCLVVERHWPGKMRASFLLLLCVVLLATAAFANEAVSTSRIPNTSCLAK